MLHMSQVMKMSNIGVSEGGGYAWVCTSVSEGGCVWDEFSEYLLETRFLTSANYNTHPPLRIFFHQAFIIQIIRILTGRVSFPKFAFFTPPIFAYSFVVILVGHCIYAAALKE